MKKILYGTTALLAAGMISTAANAAEPLKLQLGGFADWMVGYADQDGQFEATQGTTKYNAVDVRGDVEVHFKGESQLDNGLKVGVKVELEAGQSSETIDESYMTVDGAFGRVLMGSTKNVTSKLHVSAPELGGLAIEESDLVDFVGGLTNVANANINATYSFNDNDSNKIAYFTPSYNGLSLATSYTPKATDKLGNEDSNAYTQSATASPEAFAVAALYDTKLGEVGMKTSAGYVQYTSANTTGNTVDDYNVGVEFKYAGFTYGGAYRWFDGDSAGDAAIEGEVWNVGAAYQAGPYGVSLAYMTGSTDNGNATSNPVSTTDLSYEEILLTGKYNLGAGVDSFATLAHASVDPVGTNTGNTAYAFVTGFQLAF